MRLIGPVIQRKRSPILASRPFPIALPRIEDAEIVVGTGQVREQFDHLLPRLGLAGRPVKLKQREQHHRHRKIGQLPAGLAHVRDQAAGQGPQSNAVRARFGLDP